MNDVALVYGGGELRVEPNPASENGTVTIEGSKDTDVYVLVPGERARRKVRLGADGKATIDVPVGSGKEFVVTTMKAGGKEVVVDVVSPLR